MDTTFHGHYRLFLEAFAELERQERPCWILGRQQLQIQMSWVECNACWLTGWLSLACFYSPATLRTLAVFRSNRKASK